MIELLVKANSKPVVVMIGKKNFRIKGNKAAKKVINRSFDRSNPEILKSALDLKDGINSVSFESLYATSQKCAVVKKYRS